MAFEKASCNETLLLRTASQELHVDTAVGYTNVEDRAAGENVISYTLLIKESSTINS